MKTYTPKAETITRNWHHIDAKGQVLGRVSSQVAQLLIGKNKPYFVSHLDCGDYVLITNADKIIVTGNKLNKKMYYRHSGFPGGLRTQNLKQSLEKDPTRVLEIAVKGMLPKNKLRDPRLRRLKIFIGEVHPYQDKLNATQKITNNNQ